MNRRGLTLMEVVVALAVLSIIGGLTVSVLGGVLTVREYFEKDDEVHRAARLSLSRIKRELKVAFLAPNTTPNTYQTIFVGKDNSDEDQLWFTALSHKRKFINSKESDQAEISLWVEDGPDERGSVLMRREIGRIDHEPDQGGSNQPMVDQIKRFNLRYLDSQTNEWSEEWDSTGVDTPNRLPRCVEILLEVETEDPDDPSDTISQTYISSVIIEMAEPMKRSLLSGNGGNTGGILP